MYQYGAHEMVPRNPERAYEYIKKGLENNSSCFDTDTYKCAAVVEKLEAMKAALDYLKGHPFPSPTV